MDRQSNLISYSQKSRTAVIIDRGVDNYQMLVAGAIATAETIALDSNRNGIEQITEVLAQRSKIDAIHIISHGSPGCLYLGNAQLNLDTIANYIEDLQQWQGDIFLYGCNVAAGDAGAEFLQKLQKITGANIAASANLTGSATLGGDWELEVRTGKIETTRIFVEAIAKNYNSVFAIERVSVDSSGNEANGVSSYPTISGNGRFVSFSSVADNLVSGDTNETQDVFIHDRETGSTNLVSVNSAGEPGNGYSYNSSISGDGRFIVFGSDADNLVPGDTNEVRDVFIHDRETGSTSLVSVNSAGEHANSGSGNGIITADGSEIVFSSSADNLVVGDTNEEQDIFVRNLETGITSRVSLDSLGNQINGSSSISSISANGRFIAFSSDADNLVPGEENCQIYIRDRETGTISCITAESHPGSRIGKTTISNDGRFIAFQIGELPLDWFNLPAGVPAPINTFLYDRLTGESNRISSFQSPVISADGRFVSLTKGRTGYNAGGGSNGMVFIHDLRSNITTTAFTLEESEVQRTQSFSAPPAPEGWAPEFSSISADGSLIAFNSFVDDLVPEDTNSMSDIFVVDNLLANRDIGNTDTSQPLIGTAEDDILRDMDGQDSILGLEGDDNIDGGNGSDVIFGNRGLDRLNGDANNDTIYGGKDNDRIFGDGGNDWLYGERDNDRLEGEHGNDNLFGGKGEDSLYGSNGSDRLSGDLDDDTLIGGSGQDIFVLTVGGGNDTISDFEDGIDLIELAGGLNFSQLALAIAENNTISIIVASSGEIIGTMAQAEKLAIASDDFIGIS